MTLHRVAVGQRSQGDGEEQAPVPTSQSQESAKVPLQSSTKPKNTTRKTSKEVLCNIGAVNKVLLENTELESTLALGKECTPNKQSSDNLLPEVVDIACKLTKVSIMSSPDTHLLNAPPKDLHTKKIIPITPKTQNSSSFQYSRERTSNVYTQRRKDPKFVPYEPYKGCVKPILTKKIRKSSKQCLAENPTLETIEQETNNEACEGKQAQNSDGDADQRNAEKVSIYSSCLPHDD